MIRIVIVQEMGLFRGVLRTLFSSERDLEVIGEVADPVDLYRVVVESRPDVVLLDLELPGSDMFTVLQRLLTASAGTAVLVLSSQRGPEVLQKALRAGARGFVTKDIPPAELVRQVRAVAAGGRVIDPVTAAAALRRKSGPLTERELEVLRAAAEGLRSKDIARRLFLASGTVRNHLSSILRKTGARNRLEAIRRGQQEGWL